MRRKYRFSTRAMQRKAVKSPRQRGLTFIEQLHAVSVQLCPNSRVPFIIGWDDKEAILLRGSCKLWSCPVCGARNGRQWLARLIKHMNESGKKTWYFITITAHEKMRGKDASLKNLREGWKKLYNRIRRKYGRTDYAKVWEFHEDGTFHLHILYGKKIGKRWLKNNARSCGMGYMVDSSAAKNIGQVAGYAAKYLIKSFGLADYYPKSLRRIEVSRDWTKLEKFKDDRYDWFVVFDRESSDRVAKNLKAHGYKIIDSRPKEKRVRITGGDARAKIIYAKLKKS